jgi:hypothetical protein
MNEYQMTHLTQAARAERRAEADRHRLVHSARGARSRSTSPSGQTRRPRLASLLRRA